MPGIVEDKKPTAKASLNTQEQSDGLGLDSPAADPFSPVFHVLFPQFRSRLHSQLANPNYDSVTTFPPTPFSSKQANTGVSSRSDSEEKIFGDTPIQPISVQSVGQEANCPTISVTVPEITLSFDEGSNNVPEIGLSPILKASSKEVDTKGKREQSKQKLKFLLKDGEATVDVLHNKATHTVCCTPNACHGSILMPHPVKVQGQARKREDLTTLAEDFVNQYYERIDMLHSVKHKERLVDVRESIQALGTYEMTINELTFAAKTAWRNSARCIGRKQWTRLQVFDFRQISTAYEMFEALCSHLRYATNGGNIRSTLTLFPHHKYQGKDFKMWNKMMISFAGYPQDDGSVIGDPGNVKFTKLCESFGWRGKGGQFDVLPWLLQAAGRTPEMYNVPEELVLRVKITHPKYPALEELGLEWYAVPGISSMVLDCGGLEFACPFNGWYMTTEISVRNFLDVNRYNLLSAIAEKIGLNIKTQPALWKDLASAEMNIAVLTSFQKAGVTIMDQHTAADTFMSFLEAESRERGGCPADWVWIVPPISGSLTPVFHQEMLSYRLTPSYEYQTMPWETEATSVGENGIEETPVKSIEDPAKLFAVRTNSGLNRRMSMRKVRCSILYATETGKSERFAQKLYKLFNQSFAATVCSMHEYDVNDLRYEDMVLIVASTFGNGDPPANGEKFANDAFGMMFPESVKISSPATAMLAASDNTVFKSLPRGMLLSNVRFSVFALGSSMYSNFCAFGRYLDSLLEAQGGERMYPCGEGDDLYGQAEEFWKWSEGVFKAACSAFCIENEDGEINIAINNASSVWTKDKYKLEKVKTGFLQECEALGKLHGTTNIILSNLKKTKQLQAAKSERQTILVQLRVDDQPSLKYQPGDHLCVYPHNSTELVDKILSKTAESASDVIYVLKICDGDGGWTQGRLPPCSLRTALTKYLDITVPPEQEFVRSLEQLATYQNEKEKLLNLTKDIETFEAWKMRQLPTLGDIVDEFPSIVFSAEFLLSQLPVLKPRFYSISSAPDTHRGEVHLTVAVVKYRTEGTNGSERFGVCSNWLNSIHEGHPVYCCVRRAETFHLPVVKCAPVLMVGPGTGVAPFRGFWQQRSMEMIINASRPSPDTFGPMTLYFGCRETEVDDILKDERDRMLEHGVLSAQHTAYSRQANHPKVYVQHLMADNKVDIYRQIVDEGGHVYVCGDSSMAADVREQVEKILHQVGGVPLDEAKVAVTFLKEQNRYHEDIFGTTFNLKEKMKTTVPEARLKSQRRASFIDTPRPPSMATWKPTGNLLGVPGM